MESKDSVLHDNPEAGTQDDSQCLNFMCLSCARLGADCKGTKCQVWTGCVYKITQTAT